MIVDTGREAERKELSVKRSIASTAVSMLLLAVVTACGGGDSEGTTEPPPTVTTPYYAIALNDTIQREIKTIGVPDTLRFVATTPVRIHISLQRLAPSAQTLQFRLVDSTTREVIAGTDSAFHPASNLGPDLGHPSLQWIPLPKAATYLIIVTEYLGGTSPVYVGGYRLRLVGGDTRPESAAPIWQAGDTLTESIDKPGDIDEFAFVTAGVSKDYVYAVRAETGNPADTILVETGGAVGIPIVASSSTDSHMIPTELGVYDVRGDTVRVRIRANRAATLGRYRFTFYRVNRPPEHAPAQLAAGDTVSERFDYSRDIDEYSFFGDPLHEYAIALHAMSGSVRDTILLSYWQPSQPGVSEVQLRAVGNRARLLVTMTDRFQGKSYSIRVVGVDDVVPRGDYRLVVIRINRKPETAPEFVATGDTITERLEFIRDIDVFNIPIKAGENFVVYGEHFGDDTSFVGFRVDALPGVDVGPPGPGIAFAARGRSPNIRAKRSRIFGSNQDGIMQLRFSGEFYEGTYRFAIARLQPQPETANPNVTLNVITNETLDPPGDIDEYTMDCVAGQELVAYMAASNRTPGGLGSIMTVFAPGGGAYLAPGSPTLFEGGGTGRFLVMGTGKCRLTVGPASLTEADSTNGLPVPYQIILQSISRAPEDVPALLRVGDTIVETLPAGDIDEFQLSLTAGVKFEACIQELSPVPPPEKATPWVMAVVPILTQGRNDAQSSAGDSGPTCVGPFTAATTATSVFPVRGNELGPARYRLSIRAVP